MIKLSNFLKEMLDEAGLLPSSDSKDPYPFGYEDEKGNVVKSTVKSEGQYDKKYTFPFKNVDGIKMNVTIDSEMLKSGATTFIIAFDVADKSGDEKFTTKTGSGDIGRIIATVKKAVNVALNNLGIGMEDLEAIAYEPASPARDRLYKMFIRSEFPEYKESERKEKNAVFIRDKNKDQDVKESKD